MKVNDLSYLGTQRKARGIDGEAVHFSLAAQSASRQHTSRHTFVETDPSGWPLDSSSQMPLPHSKLSVQTALAIFPTPLMQC